MSILNKIQIDNCSKHMISEEIFSEVLELVVIEEKLSPDTFLFLKLTDDDTIKEMNKKYFGKDDYTDVISFNASIPNFFLLGDILIDIRIADLQRENRTLEEELQILFLHGILHLLGYDHLSKIKREEMSSKEHKYLNILRENTKSGR